MAVTDARPASARVSTHRMVWRFAEMRFCVGDEVCEGLHTGVITDVGTVLVEVKMTTGTSRMVCPWELVRLSDTAK
jgi:hypothetical protein